MNDGISEEVIKQAFKEICELITNWGEGKKTTELTEKYYLGRKKNPTKKDFYKAFEYACQTPGVPIRGGGREAENYFLWRAWYFVNRGKRFDLDYREQIILGNIDSRKFEWIVRDENGHLKLLGKEETDFSAYDHLFEFIEKDDEPYEIKYLASYYVWRKETEKEEQNESRYR